MQVDIFIPCFVDQLFPSTAVNMVKILRKVGCEVHYNTNQTCCGQAAFNAGYWKEAQEVGQKFIKDFQTEHKVICPSASCVAYVKNYVNKLFQDTYPEERLAVDLGKKIIEFSDFLVNELKVTDVGASYLERITYHDSCAALRECDLKTEPRKLLQKVKGLELIEADNCEVCCGFGGTFSSKFEPISVAMAEQKVEAALDLKVKSIVSTDLSCLMQLDAYIKYHNYPLSVLHIIDVLAQGQNWNLD